MSEETNGQPKYDYIVVGSGAGGGPLAVNLAEKGHSVLLLEAGGRHEPDDYKVPAFHGKATEEPRLAWDYFVSHYDDAARRARDRKNREELGGVLYPRAGTLGGCTAHYAMIIVRPHDSDWDKIATETGDESWRSGKMHKYFQRLEHCLYVDRDNNSGHGFGGWLPTRQADIDLVSGDEQLKQIIISAATAHPLTLPPISKDLNLKAAFSVLRKAFDFIIDESTLDELLNDHLDPNDQRVVTERREGVLKVPTAIDASGRRAGTRKRILKAEHKTGVPLEVRTDALVTRVLFSNDDPPRATGVEYMAGVRLYRASKNPNPVKSEEVETIQVTATKEVILCAGAFNTPQILMLSGIGPKDVLEAHGITPRLIREGVGKNLQDRYEVGIVAELQENFHVLQNATFKSPDEGHAKDPEYIKWEENKEEGLYATNGAVIAFIKRSEETRHDPDLFVFGVPGHFIGYYPGWSEDAVRPKNLFTWLVLKAHTNNKAGCVTLRSADPRDTPLINFKYFEDGGPGHKEDAQAVANGVRFVRGLLDRSSDMMTETIPGPSVKDGDLEQFVKDNAWGHHASCTCKMGRSNDPDAVVDSAFRVIGTENLRVVDASIFPEIPGFFIVAPIYMISEKASEVILQDA